MQTKPLLSGLIGFFIGGLLVSVAATTFDKPQYDRDTSSMSMTEMADSLRNKTGDDYDKAFIDGMIEHHEGAIEMAKLSAKNAKHEEIKKLSEAIITAQASEIQEMNTWRMDWGYGVDTMSHQKPSH